MSTEGISSEAIAQAISWRRHLHKYPELAYQERQTSDFVASQLSHYGFAVHRGLACSGVVGTLKRGAGSRAIGIRADMDALPIVEKSGVTHSSQTPGVMHACGHDGHVAIALAAARACAGLDNLNGTVHFIFQPAEENEGGAKRMVDEGLFEIFPCDAIYALHNWPSLPLGSFVARDGAMLAAFALFEIVIAGRGCHGAMPHEGTDCMLAASQVVCALQSIASRNVDPRQAAVVSVTQMHGGDTCNTLPDHCSIRGTARWFDDAAGEVIERRLKEVSDSIAMAFGCEARVRYERRIPATINDRSTVRFLRDVAAEPALGLTCIDAEPTTGSEDFAFMLEKIPGCYLLLGSGRAGENPGLHSPQYDFNDAALPLGAALWVSLVRRSLANT